MDFTSWLEQKKGISPKSAHDVASRLKRVRTILQLDTIDAATIQQLERCGSFAELTMTVRSQLRRTVRLYLEFQE